MYPLPSKVASTDAPSATEHSTWVTQMKCLHLKERFEWEICCSEELMLVVNVRTPVPGSCTTARNPQPIAHPSKQWTMLLQ